MISFLAGNRNYVEHSIHLLEIHIIIYMANVNKAVKTVTRHIKTNYLLMEVKHRVICGQLTASV